jgi:hypothetical protein
MLVFLGLFVSLRVFVDQGSDDTAPFPPLLCYSPLPNADERMIGSFSSNDSSVLEQAAKVARGFSVWSGAF